MFFEPFRVVSGVVEDDIDHSQHSPFFPDLFEHFLHLLRLLLLVPLDFVFEEVVGEFELFVNRVGRVTLSSLLQRSVVNHVVTALAHDVEVRCPFFESSHPFRNDTLNN